MLRDESFRGFQDALAAFGLKEAGVSDWARSAWQDVKATPGVMWRGLTGDPAARSELLKGRAFAPNGKLSLKNIWWPTEGNTAVKWLSRAGTVLPALEAYSALRGNSGNPHEGRLTNALGSIGQAVGNAYGFPLGGLIGGGILSTVGRRIGTGLGRVLGSRPDAPPPRPPYYQLAPYDPGVPQ